MQNGEEMIIITGGTVSQQGHVESMVRFCLQRLMPRLAYKVDIRVQMTRSLLKEEGFLGLCSDLDDDPSPRSFLIELDSTQRLRTLLITLAHEMVHVKQSARNEYRFLVKEGKYKWQGQHIDPKTTDYWDYPWEIEAHGREIGLFVNWCKAKGHTNKKWVRDLNER